MVKRDGRRESFDRTKLAMGLRRAIAKRPIDAEQINALLSDTLRRIENEFAMLVHDAPKICHDMFARTLRALDRIERWESDQEKSVVYKLANDTALQQARCAHFVRRPWSRFTN